MGNYVNLQYSIVKKKINDHRKNLKRTRYILDEKLLADIIKNHLSDYKESKLEYVYFISTLINSFYSTRMGGDRLYEVAKYISKYKNVQNIKSVIKIINKASQEKFLIKYANIDKESKKFKAYSFLSKYYAIHNRIIYHNGEFSEFPICDNRVEKQLKRIIHSVKNDNKKYYSDVFVEKMKHFKIQDIKSYDKLYNMLCIIAEEINHTKRKNQVPANLTTVDKYFWSFE